MEKQKITINKSNILELFDFFGTIRGEKNKHYVEWCMRNKNILKIEKDIIDELIKYSETQQEYLQKEFDILSKYAIQEDGNIKMPPVIPKEHIDNFNDDIQKLKQGDETTYESVVAKNKEKEELLLEEIEIELHVIKYEFIPESIESEVYIYLREREIIIE